MTRKPIVAALCAAALLTFSARLARAAQTPTAPKQLVLDFFRVVFEAEDAEAARGYLHEGYIQHNPLVATGRKGFIDYFKTKWKKPKPVEPRLRQPPESVVAEGDLVSVMWKVSRPEPSDGSKSYDSFWFDLFRVKDGLIVEHWDNALK